MVQIVKKDVYKLNFNEIVSQILVYTYLSRFLKMVISRILGNIFEPSISAGVTQRHFFHVCLSCNFFKVSFCEKFIKKHLTYIRQIQNSPGSEMFLSSRQSQESQREQQIHPQVLTACQWEEHFILLGTILFFPFSCQLYFGIIRRDLLYWFVGKFRRMTGNHVLLFLLLQFNCFGDPLMNEAQPLS